MEAYREGRVKIEEKKSTGLGGGDGRMKVFLPKLRSLKTDEQKEEFGSEPIAHTRRGESARLGRSVSERDRLICKPRSFSIGGNDGCVDPKAVRERAMPVWDGRSNRNGLVILMGGVAASNGWTLFNR